MPWNVAVHKNGASKLSRYVPMSLALMLLAMINVLQ